MVLVLKLFFFWVGLDWKWEKKNEVFVDTNKQQKRKRRRERESSEKTAPPTHTSKGHQVLFLSKKQVCTIKHHDSPPICEYALREFWRERVRDRDGERESKREEECGVFLYKNKK